MINKATTIKKEQILVIKHGALGDIILATGPMAAIRKQHLTAHITVLTTRPFADLLGRSPYVDEVWCDSRPKLWQVGRMLMLSRKLRSRKFSWVYDLQTSSRSSLYWHLMRSPKPDWSGIAAKASHRHDTPHRTSSHTVTRQKEQLALAGIYQVPLPDVSWLEEDISGFALDNPFVLLIPGGSAHRPEKRWPADHFVSLAQKLVEKELQPVLTGTKAEEKVLKHIHKAVPECINLCGKTSFAQLASLGRQAKGVVGNDTGPVHLIAATRCPTVVMFSSASNPALCAPRGEHVQVLQKPDLADLPVRNVMLALEALLDTSENSCTSETELENTAEV